ncbi:MAG: putative peptidoglycan glycosyltransferase FtsW [Eubacteriales bacterium]|nr:putative peptidoglycan glycosyltransferase FtsW [Eubacteriales bacterium]
MAKKRAKDNSTRFRDYSLLFIILFLLAFGLVMLYSTSSYEAALEFGSSAYYLRRQLIFTVIGLGIMGLVSRIPYHFWQRVAVPAYVAAMILILMIIPFGTGGADGAKRWIYFGPISVQPAEIAKVATILMTAALINRLGKRGHTGRGFALILAVPVPIALMLWRITTNLSSAIIVVLIVVGMLFVACPYYKRFFLMGGAVLAVGALAIYVVTNAADSSTLDFRGRRILAWLDPEAYAGDTAFQTLQALYAIGSGGLFGKGLGQSMQKLGYIPEAQNDMIFSIVCEELGLFGAVCIILMFILLLWRFLVIANNAEDLFGALLVVGVMMHIAVQVILNIAVVTNTIPNTGVTLPFISYGGSAVVVLLGEIGIVLSVARTIRLGEL